MTETPQEKPVRRFEVGPDQVTISEGEACIEAKHAFTDWEVREINHVPVYLEDKKYFLVEKRKAPPPHAVRYVLVPWPEYQGSNAKGFLTYDAQVVGERESQVRDGHVEDLGHAFLTPLYPLLGMLWSGMQRRLVRFGFVPHAITGFSILTTFSLLFGQGVFAVILLNTSLRMGKVVVGGFLRAIAPGDALQFGPVAVPITILDILILVALLLDVIVRYSRYLRDDQWCGGFLEWLVPRRWTRHAAVDQAGEP